MSFKISWHPRAENSLNKLQKDVSERIVNKLDEVAEDLFRYLEHFEGSGYKLRIGDYRALIDVDFEKKILFVRVLDKRGRVYKR